MTSPTCPRCSSAELDTIRTPAGPHYAKVTCLNCDRFIKWLPRPASSTPPAVDRPAWQAPALLRGSPAQTSVAETLRAVMLRKCKIAGLTRTAQVIAAVVDASWFLANRDRPLDELRWPTEAQLEPTAAGVAT